MSTTPTAPAPAPVAHAPLCCRFTAAGPTSIPPRRAIAADLGAGLEDTPEEHLATVTLVTVEGALLTLWFRPEELAALLLELAELYDLQAVQS